MADKSSAAVGPTKMMAGAFSSAARVFSASWASGARTATGRGPIPLEITAAGVSARFPAESSPSAIPSRLASPMRNTSVPARLARVPQPPAGSPRSSKVWPVITWKLRLTPR